MGWMTGSTPGWGRDLYLFANTSRLAVRTTQPPIQYVLWALSLDVKCLGHEGDHAAPKNVQSYISTSPYIFMVRHLVKYRISSWRGAWLHTETTIPLHY
jgi:hypothetical protein